MDREALYAALDAFLAALDRGDSASVNWARDARFSENNVMLATDDGVWGTVQGLGAYQLRFADTRTGQVGYFGTLIEAIEESALTVRLALNPAGEVQEAELLIVRQSDSGIKFENPLLGQADPASRAGKPGRSRRDGAALEWLFRYPATQRRHDPHPLPPRLPAGGKRRADHAQS
jgi:hypothetical protein